MDAKVDVGLVRTILADYVCCSTQILGCFRIL